jgi:hypothetical protein
VTVSEIDWNKYRVRGVDTMAIFWPSALKLLILDFFFFVNFIGQSEKDAHNKE